MSEWFDEAIVLNLGQFHETDLWLKMLCRQHGLATIFAFGGSVSKRRFCGCLDVFNTLKCKIQISRNGRYLNLQEAVLKEGAANLRSCWKNFGMGANCLRFLEAAAIDEANGSACFELTENLRQAISVPSPHPLLPQFFRLRLAGILGYAPALEYCGHCGHKITSDCWFVVDAAQTVCPACQESGKIGRYHIYLPANSLFNLQFVRNSLPAEWQEIRLTGMEKRACAKMVDAFVQFHLGLAWDNGFYRRV